MSDTISIICESILALLIAYHFLRSFFNKDKTLIWSPISTVSLTYLYYCVWPFFGPKKEIFQIVESFYDGYLFHIAALLSYVFILIGFSFSSRANFKRWNHRFSKKNSGTLGLLITLIGILGYSSVRGFHFTFAISNASDELAIGGFVYYLMMAINLLTFGGALLLVALKNNKVSLLYWVVFWFILVQFLIAGARWRIVVTAITMLTTFYLYPKPKKANLGVIMILAFIMYLGFSAMDTVRSRGRGIDVEKAKSLKYDDIKGGAFENESVYTFSLKSMYYLHESGVRCYFTPIITAVAMPIPRFLFPWKPDASYFRIIEVKVNGDFSGAAYLNFVESYYSFGWFGVIFWAWFLGWFARRFWDNYQRNKASIGAIVGLGVISGLCYTIISRGYLASTLTSLIICLCVPFWIANIYKQITTKKIK